MGACLFLTRKHLTRGWSDLRPPSAGRQFKRSRTSALATWSGRSSCCLREGAQHGSCWRLAGERAGLGRRAGAFLAGR